MAGLKSSSTDLSCFHFSDTKAVTAAKLKQFAFRSIDDAKTEELAFGWVNMMIRWIRLGRFPLQTKANGFAGRSAWINGLCLLRS